MWSQTDDNWFLYNISSFESNMSNLLKQTIILRHIKYLKIENTNMYMYIVDNTSNEV